MGYPKEVIEFIKVRLEQTPNNTQIARDVKNKFEIYKEQDWIRRDISRIREELKIEARTKPIKRLFFDIETGYYILKIRAWQLKNYTKYFNFEDIEKQKEIVCISYAWDSEDKIQTLDYRMGEKKMLKEFIKIMGEADECIGHNGDNFDIKELRARCIYHGVLMFPIYRTLDTLKKARSSFRFPSNKLDAIGDYLGIGRKIKHRGMDMWKEVVEGDKETSDKALDEMIQYCEQDVILLRDIYHVLSPFITHNNNFAVLKGGEKWDCPECASKNIELEKAYTTPLGITRRLMKCKDCRKQYKVSNKTYMLMLENLMRSN